MPSSPAHGDRCRRAAHRCAARSTSRRQRARRSWGGERRLDHRRRRSSRPPGRRHECSTVRSRSTWRPPCWSSAAAAVPFVGEIDTDTPLLVGQPGRGGPRPDDRYGCVRGDAGVVSARCCTGARRGRVQHRRSVRRAWCARSGVDPAAGRDRDRRRVRGRSRPSRHQVSHPDPALVRRSAADRRRDGHGGGGGAGRKREQPGRRSTRA